MKRDRPSIRVVSAEIQRDGRYLITQRSAHAVLPHLWEFPGGRVRAGETDREALVRALGDRLGVEVRPMQRVMEVSHDYPDYTVTLAVWRCEIGAEEPQAQAVAGLAWVAPDDFADYPFPGADQKTVDLLLSEQA